MDQIRFEEAMEDKVFAEKLLKIETAEEVQSTFKSEKDVDMELEEAKVFLQVVKNIESGNEQLDEDDLENVAGGGIFKNIFDMFKNTIVRVIYGTTN